MTWTQQSIFFIDFEGSRGSGILEYGVATLLGAQITEAKTRLCGATGRVRPEDTEVHGLRADALAGAAPISADWEYFAGLRERGPFAAHYAGVENGLLKSVWPYPRPSPDFTRSGERVIDWGPWIDSARLCALFYPPAESGRLEALVAARGLQAELDALAVEHCPPARRRYHAALYDALAGALLLRAIGREPQGEKLTLRQVFTLSTQDPDKRDALTQEKFW